MTRITDNAVSSKDSATNKAKIEINSIEWYVPHYTLQLKEYNKFMNQITKKTPTDLHYPEKSVFMKETNTQKFLDF